MVNDFVDNDCKGTKKFGYMQGNMTYVGIFFLKNLKG